MHNNKYFIHLSYKGTNYNGWQRQKNGLGVQEVLETQLSRMFRQKMLVHGCGRTDAGVHARQYFCHVLIGRSWDFDAVFRINKMLPNDIRVHQFIPVPVRANAQLDVIHRTYTYHIHNREDPFLFDLSSFYFIQNPDLKGMQEAAALLVRYQDYLSFCTKPDRYPHTLCQVSESSMVVDLTGHHFQFRITANRFLRSMVRMIMGYLLQIGQRKFSVEQFEALLKNPRPCTNAQLAYPQGLYLSEVSYPDFD